MKIMGASEEDIARARAAMAPADFELYEDCVQSYTVFRRMATQWRVGGMDGVPYGLDYTVFEVFCTRMGVPEDDRNQVFEDVGLMETETLRVIADRRAQQA